VSTSTQGGLPAVKVSEAAGRIETGSRAGGQLLS